MQRTTISVSCILLALLALLAIYGCAENGQDEKERAKKAEAEKKSKVNRGDPVVSVGGAVFSRDGKSLLVCYQADWFPNQQRVGRAAVLWDVAAGELVWKVALGENTRPLGFLADDKGFVLDARDSLETRNGVETRDMRGELIQRFAVSEMSESGTSNLDWPEAFVSADGETVFTVNRFGLKQWNPKTGKLVRDVGKDYKRQILITRNGPLLGPIDGVPTLADLEVIGAENPKRWTNRVVAISANGNLAATSYSDTTVWDIARKTVVRNFLRHASFVGFSADDKRLITADTKGITTWSLETGRELWTTEEARIDGLGFALSRHGTIAFTADGVAEVFRGRLIDQKLWDVANGKLLHVLRDPQ
jgi:hypothetical protein